ncbi:GT2 family glycosyltransferase [Jejuia pallidilutea]|uniref:GT2 family glycosyltransferase n=1 Tax=Jejuia pallidilutea TaxID=504487 RepID=A0A362XBR1_9FLAO|nr:glycosyltransferase [Jejuia pallidilutea]PQV48202.1 GT2 family glycosyltransferase [Jejuia pallidilutea]
MKGLSVCIPVYNYDCLKTVVHICKQIKTLKLAAEIIVFDDASTLELTKLSTFKNPIYTYKKLQNNVGRSKIRNLLVKASAFDYVLFLDGDSKVSENFIATYIETIKKQPNTIIYGGTSKPKRTNTKNKLRYNYGLKYEYKTTLKRNENPYHHFRPNNFVSPKHILKINPFNEELDTYGHEDTFFCYEMEKKGIEIIHINNPVIHLDMDSNIEFIEKTKTAIKNLILLKKKHPEFTSYSKLLLALNKFKFLNSVFAKKIATLLSVFFERAAIKTNSANSLQLFKFCYIVSIQNHYD